MRTSHAMELNDVRAIRIFVFVVAVVHVCVMQGAAAAVIKEINSECFLSSRSCDHAGWSILVDGPIETGDSDKFFKALEDMNGRAQTVILRSLGGSVVEALRIGRVVRKLLLETQAPNLYPYNEMPQCLEVRSAPARAASCVCASACFLIYAAGVPRNVAFIYLHRPFVNPTVNRELGFDEAVEVATAIRSEVTKYLQDMEVPDRFINAMLSTPSNRIVVPTYDEMRDELAGYPQAIDEWLMAKCDILSFAQNEARFDELLDKNDQRTLGEFKMQEKLRNDCIFDALSPKREEGFSTWLLERRNRK